MKRFFLVLTVASVFLPDITRACDLCAIYNSIESHKMQAGRAHIGIAEQFTYFGTVQDNGKHAENEAHQHLASSISQAYGAYDISDGIGLQLNLPYINRRFKRVEDGGVRSGTEAGVGDMTLLARFLPYAYKEMDTIFYLHIFTGLKMPTGSSDRLKEELEVHHADGSTMVDEEAHADEHTGTDHEDSVAHLHSARLSTRHSGHVHDEVASVIHGHDLALGSGSWDFPLGIHVFAQQGRAIASAAVQYAIRTEGDHSYEYADDLTWNAGPAYYLALDDEYSIAAMLNLSGEYKRKDTGPNGEKQDDTGIRAVYLGPQVLFTVSNSLSGELGLDLPLDINNSGTQSVPDYRIRAGLTFVF